MTSSQFLCRTTALTLMLVAAFDASAVAQSVNEDPFAAARAQYDAAYSLILSQEWREAARRFENLTTVRSIGDRMDDASFWRCYAIEKQGESTERAYRCYEDLRQAFGDSEWADDAAAAMVRLGQKLSVTGSDEYRANISSMTQDRSDHVAVTAIHALAEPGKNDVLPALTRIMERNDAPSVRRAVVQALVKVNTPEARAFLLDVARTERDPRVRVEAVHALGAVRANEAGEVLVTILNDADNPDVQRSAVHALHRIGTQNAARALIEILEREANPSVLREAVFAAADLAGTDVLPALGRVLRRSDALEVQLSAVQALHRLDSPSARRELIRVLRESDDPRLRREAAMALAAPRENDGVEILSKVALGDPSTQVREAAAQALARIGTARAREALTDVLLQSTDDR